MTFSKESSAEYFITETPETSTGSAVTTQYTIATIKAIFFTGHLRSSNLSLTLPSGAGTNPCLGFGQLFFQIIMEMFEATPTLAALPQV